MCQLLSPFLEGDGRKGSRDIKMSGVRTWWHVRVERECEEGGCEEGEVGGGWGCEEDGMEIGDRHYRRIRWNQRPWKRRGLLTKAVEDARSGGHRTNLMILAIKT